jgi:glycosyltransferase involved in cell wall biosynthesis
VRGGNGARSEVGETARSLFLVEYALGHRTHAQFLERHLAEDSRFDAEVIRLSRPGMVADLLAKLQIPPLHRRGLDFWVWWLIQYKRTQVRAALRRRDAARLDLFYVHTQTAAAAALDLPRHVPVVVSIDLTWKLAFRESRYVASPAFEPTYRLERKIFERSDLVVSFSDWAAASVIEDYGIPASKVAVVRNGITLPNGLGLGASNGRAMTNGNGHGYGTNGHGDGSGAHQNGNGHASGANGLLRLGFVGNGFTRKGGDLLLRVHQERFADEAHLTLVTTEPLRQGTLQNVSVRADVPWDELMTSVLPGFDLFVFPTRFDYSPYAVIEAMTAGVPVIATRVGAIPEMIEDGVSGFLLDAPREIPLVERVGWAVENRARLPAMGDKARRHAAGSYAAAENYPRLLDLLAGVAR